MGTTTIVNTANVSSTLNENVKNVQSNAISEEPAVNEVAGNILSVIASKGDESVKNQNDKEDKTVESNHTETNSSTHLPTPKASIENTARLDKKDVTVTNNNPNEK